MRFLLLLFIVVVFFLPAGQAYNTCCHDGYVGSNFINIIEWLFVGLRSNGQPICHILQADIGQGILCYEIEIIG